MACSVDGQSGRLEEEDFRQVKLTGVKQVNLASLSKKIIRELRNWSSVLIPIKSHLV